MKKFQKKIIQYSLFVFVDGRKHKHLSTINNALWRAKQKRLDKLGVKHKTEYKILGNVKIK